ncbi:hypothetical protein ACLQ3H_24345 [Micromonospora saelicesensis]|uniref:hypothetical protein n=1 Tax=Micromonospora saelicesensis TaxID=285676 RepID=UPI003CF5F293
MRSLTPRGLVAARPGRLPAHTSPVIGLSHSGTTVTESVYRHQLRPVLLGGAVAMDRIFDAEA